MPRKAGTIGAALLIPFVAVVMLFMLNPGKSESNRFWDFPPKLPPEEYGNILISRTSVKNGVKPATFSHWIHRRKYTCRVCHFELEFSFKANTTEITEAANKEGKFCGACHNGTIAFGHTDANCEKCHNGNRAYGKEKFPELARLPKAGHGNGVDWVKAVAAGAISPLYTLTGKPVDVMPFDKTLTLEAEWFNIPPSYFSHAAHTKWLDCNDCHPEIFNIKKKTTKHFSMDLNLQGRFCGTCHLTVALPMEDCRSCHPGISQN